MNIQEGYWGFTLGKIRCVWHLLVGALIPWLPLLGGITLTLMFLGYEYLQYKHHSTRLMRDDSYKDVYEAAVALGISAVVKLILASI